MDTSPQKRQEITESDIDFALKLMAKGRTLPELQKQLVERGLSDDQVEGVISELFRMQIYSLAESHLNEGKAAETVTLELVRYGLEPLEASQVVSEIRQFREQQQQLFREAIELLANGESSRKIEKTFLARGLQPELVKYLLREARGALRWEVRKVGLKNVGLGFGIFALGAGITLGSLLFAGVTGVWVISAGFLLSGLVILVRGIWQMLTGWGG
jgi:SOS response regulatory protein OraA/RecX